MSGHCENLLTYPRISSTLGLAPSTNCRAIHGVMWHRGGADIFIVLLAGRGPAVHHALGHVGVYVKTYRQYDILML